MPVKRTVSFLLVSLFLALAAISPVRAGETEAKRRRPTITQRIAQRVRDLREAIAAVREARAAEAAACRELEAIWSGLPEAWRERIEDRHPGTGERMTAFLADEEPAAAADQPETAGDQPEAETDQLESAATKGRGGQGEGGTPAPAVQSAAAARANVPGAAGEGEGGGAPKAGGANYQDTFDVFGPAPEPVRAEEETEAR